MCQTTTRTERKGDVDYQVRRHEPSETGDGATTPAPASDLRITVEKLDLVMFWLAGGHPNKWLEVFGQEPNGTVKWLAGICRIDPTIKLYETCWHL